MAYRCLVLVVLAIALASCSPGRRANPPAKSDADTATRPALTQTQPPEAAGRSYMLLPGAGGTGGVPDMEAGRRINNQPCTKEVDLTAGNLKCQ